MSRDKRLWERQARWPVAGTLTSLQVATLGPSGGVVAGLFVSGGLDVMLPCASAKRSRLLPEVFDDCSSVSRRRSLRDGAIIREVSETAIALNFLDCPLTWHRLHFVVSAL